MKTQNMFKSLLLCMGVITVSASSIPTTYGVSLLNDAEFTLALQWAGEKGMTRFTDESSFQPLQALTREQAAKFFAEFAKKELQKQPDLNMSCSFSDSAKIDPTLQASVIESCQLGLFQGYQGMFDPQQPLTKAQALTVLVRALVGKQDETGTPRWTEYFRVAQQRGRTKETNVMAVDKYVTRYEALLLQFRARGDATALTPTPTNTGVVENTSDDTLSQILQELFGESFEDTTGDVVITTGATTFSGSVTTSGDVSTGSGSVSTGTSN